MAVNTVTVIGNLGGDPQIRALPSGDSVANFSLATTERFKDRNGASRNAPNGIASWSSGSWPRPARSISARAARSMSKDG